MAAIQEICARIGRATGCGLAANLRKNYRFFIVVRIAMSGANVDGDFRNHLARGRSAC